MYGQTKELFYCEKQKCHCVYCITLKIYLILCNICIIINIIKVLLYAHVIMDSPVFLT